MIKNIALALYLLLDVAFMIVIVARAKVRRELLTQYFSGSAQHSTESAWLASFGVIRNMKATIQELPAAQRERLKKMSRLTLTALVMMGLIVGFPFVAYRIF